MDFFRFFFEPFARKFRWNRCFGILLWSILATLGLRENPALAQTPGAKEILRCSKMIESNQYAFAAECFRQLADSIEDKPGMLEQDRAQKGYLYGEASKCMELAAVRERKPEVAAYLREQALGWLEKVIERQWLPLIRGKRRSRVYADMLLSLRTKIRYTPLAISTGSPKAKLQVSGYQFLASGLSQFNRSLRPGVYKVSVFYEGEATARTREVSLQPNVSLVLTFAQKPPLSGLLLSGYIVGGIGFVGGAILLSIGIARIQGGNTCFNDPECAFFQGAILKRSELPTNLPPDQRKIDNKTEFQAYNNTSLAFAISGAALAFVGLAAIVVAGIFHARLAKEDFTQKEMLVPSSPSTTLLWASP